MEKISEKWKELNDKYSFNWNKVNGVVYSVNDNINFTLDLNLDNYIKVILSEFFSAKTILFSGKSERSIIKDIDFWLWEEKFPGIWLKIKQKIKKWIKYKESEWINIDYVIKNELTKNPEVFISWIVKELELDFHNPENMWLEKNKNSSKDIPIQAKEARDAWVVDEYNGTVWILKDSSWIIVANPRIIEVLNDSLRDVNRLLNYQPWTWIESFRKAIELLIKHEEEIYNWPKIKGEITRPYFVPWGWWWLTLFRDYFLNEWDLVLLPNYRWPNIDWIIINKTKVPPAQIDLIKHDGSLNLNSIDEAIENWIRVWRKKISMYLNFPNNPSWVRMSESDKIWLNNILSKYSWEDVKIQILLDDPYWAFSVDNVDKEKLDAPLSYYIDTSKNITLFEIWSHWTKEAWVYWLRTAVLRVFWNENNISGIDKLINIAIRETFSMTPSLPQEVMVKAILWKDIDAFSNKQISELSESEINKRIWKYIDWRNDMLKNIYPKLDILKKDIIDSVWEYFIPMENLTNWKCENWWFMLGFTLTEKAKKLWINLLEFQKACFNNIDGEKDNRCAFTIFDDEINKQKVMRIAIIWWDTKEYANRLEKWIKQLISQIKNQKN